MNLRDGGHHLGAVGCETTCDGKVCPVKAVCNSETKPQKTGLGIKSVSVTWEIALEATHDAYQSPNQRNHQPHLRNLATITLDITLHPTNRGY